MSTIQSKYDDREVEVTRCTGIGEGQIQITMRENYGRQGEVFSYWLKRDSLKLVQAIIEAADLTQADLFPEPEPEPLVRFKVGDRVRLTGDEWDGVGAGSRCGDVVTVVEISDEGKYGKFQSTNGTGNWFVYAPDAMYAESWGGEIVPETNKTRWDALENGDKFVFADRETGDSRGTAVFVKVNDAGYVELGNDRYGVEQIHTHFAALSYIIQKKEEED